MFIYKTRIFLHHTDAAGRLFFANQFYLIYEAKEMFLKSLGLCVEEMLNHEKYTFPLVHAESDYKTPLKTGDEISIHVGVENIGETSVGFIYEIFTKGKRAGIAHTVSVVVDKTTGKKTPIPRVWREKLMLGMKKHD